MGLQRMVIQRGHNKSFIFNDPLDKIAFFEIVKAVQIDMPFNLIYYVLMDNHYHLLIEMIDHDISNIMRFINLKYSRFYNAKYGRLGTIYGGPYKSIEVTNARYFTQLIGYFAHNPVRAKIVKTPYDYKWCAHYDIVRNQSSLAHIGRLFELIDDSQKRAREIYSEIIQEGIHPHTENLPVDEMVEASTLVRGDSRPVTRSTSGSSFYLSVSLTLSQHPNLRWCTWFRILKVSLLFLGLVQLPER